MTFAFTNSGLQIQTYQEIYDELASAYRLIYGADINLDADSPDGQRVGIEAKARLDMQAFALSIYNQLDPDFSAGQSLNSMIKWSGLYRRPASRSQSDVTITTDRAITLLSGYAVLDDLDQKWISLTDAALVVGANTVTLVAENFGAVEADAATITTPATIIIGVISVSNPLAALVGREEETDEELRIRRNRSLINPATSSAAGMFTALGNLAGVTDLAVYENDQDIADPVLIMPPHSLWCIVEGGEVADIVESIAKNKTGGTTLKGLVSGTYTETRIKPSGEEFVFVHEMIFDRPIYLPVYISLTVEGHDAAIVDVAAIKAALAAIDLSIGQDLTAGELYAVVYSVATNFTVTLIMISDDDVIFTDSRITPGADGIFTIDVADIDITDIT